MENWLKLSIWVVSVSWHDQYIDCTDSAALPPPAFRLAIRPIVVEWLWKKLPNFCEIGGFLIATKPILLRLQIWMREENERPILHNICIDHVTIQSELRYIIGGNFEMLKCGDFGGKTSPIAMVRVFVWYDPLQWFGSGDNSNPELY